MSTIAEYENKSFGEIFACFDNQTQFAPDNELARNK